MIPYRTTISLPAILGAVIGLGVVIGGVALRRRAPAVCFAALAAGLAYLPVSNFFFPVGIVLAERNLYLAVLLPATLVGVAVMWALERWERPRVLVPLMVVLGVLAYGTLDRLPAWRDNRAFLLTLLIDHPESYRAQQSAAAVQAGLGQTAAALGALRRADSLFGGDPHLKADYAFYLITHGDTAAAVTLAREARRRLPRERVALRVDYLMALVRGERDRAVAIADTARGWFPTERDWYAATVRVDR